jgi:hypothetical protein
VNIQTSRTVPSLTWLLLLAAVLWPNPTSAQPAPTAEPDSAAETEVSEPYRYIPFGVDVVPYVGTSSAGGRQVRTVSFNLLGGLTAGIEGFEFAALLNIDTEFMEGFQMAGGASVVAGPVWGAQLAGGANLAAGPIEGAQLSGGVNIVLGHLTGLQMTSVGNVAMGLEGAQIAAVNVSTERVTGVQLGVVNLAPDADLSLGVLNVLWEGRTHVDVWGGDTGFVHAAVKHGGQFFHNIYALGVRPGDETSWSLGLGFGLHFDVGEAYYLDIDGIAHHINEGEGWTGDTNSLTKARGLVGWQVKPWLGLFAGLTYNLFVSDVSDGTQYAVFLDTLVSDPGEERVVRAWPGFVLGVQFLESPYPR